MLGDDACTGLTSLRDGCRESSSIRMFTGEQSGRDVVLCTCPIYLAAHRTNKQKHISHLTSLHFLLHLITSPTAQRRVAGALDKLLERPVDGRADLVPLVEIHRGDGALGDAFGRELEFLLARQLSLLFSLPV